MIIIDEKNDYITDRGDYYSIGVINANDSVMIELDKRLHVDGEVFVVGDLTCGDIVSDKRIIVDGNTIANDIQASEIYLMRKSNIRGNMLASENIQLGKAHIAGSIISHNNIHSISELVVLGDISAAVTITAKSSIKVAGNIAVGAVLDAHSELVCKGNVKVAGVEVFTFGRYNNGNFTCILTDDVMSIFKSNGVAEVIENINERIDEVIKDDSDAYEKEKFLVEIKDWVKNIKADIRKE